MVNTDEAAVSAAVDGEGIARIFSYKIQQEVSGGSLVVLLPEDEPPPFNVFKWIGARVKPIYARFEKPILAVCTAALALAVLTGFEALKPKAKVYTQADIDKGRGFRMKLSDADLMKDIDAAADHLAGKKLAIVGYCFGGTVAWWAATRTKKFLASSCWITKRSRCVFTSRGLRSK